ncbi:1-aminocyclopropane-1-carboxylate synthase 7 [Acorus calamus]|uniref:1-aminocyclopropane-1-carboxylate synthase 7 n=1 Tax=Acorus calamus TaxID=4465 RepID=A0AAV9EJE0_ACOCL|nr:1-aminocyclopropane-1-carboxylate synthase 7 [Acorus calamus]
MVSGGFINNNNYVGLSRIAESDTHGEDSPYFAGWKAYEENPYDALSNPSGVIQMGLAENQPPISIPYISVALYMVDSLDEVEVSFDLIEGYLEQHPEASNWGTGKSSFRDNALFQDYHGLKSFRMAMASFMEKIRGGKAKFDPDRIVLTAGATAANELLTFILANPGDGLLVPTPYYPGSNGFQITPEALETAYATASSSNIRIKALLLTNPSNPLGTCINRPTLESILDFVTLKGIHLVSDEIYSGSVFSPSDFVSIAEILQSRNLKNSKSIHLVYSLSKDLGLPGFRVGVIYSYNDEVVTTARRMSSFTLVSSQTQNLLASMLSDTEFSMKYIGTNRERLKRRCGCITEGLRESGIECLGGNAGLFCWVNMRGLLEEDTREGEVRLWRALLGEVKINISPGSSCHCMENGWFRVCFANMHEETLKVALERIRGFVVKQRKVLKFCS